MGLNNHIHTRTASRPASVGVPRPGGFTLVELLVVIVIISILATIAVPSFKGLGQSNVLAGANRQLVDDLAFARLRAINERATVYVVFAPTNSVALRQHMLSLTNVAWRKQVTNLFGAQFSGYSLYADRGVGDQPGAKRPRYLSEWKVLPDGFLIPEFKYTNSATLQNEYTRGFQYARFRFPTASSPEFELPYLAFNSKGQLVEFDTANRGALLQRDAILPLAQGSVSIARDKNGEVIPQTADVRVLPRDNFTNNYIRVTWLTGRSTVERPRVR